MKTLGLALGGGGLKGLAHIGVLEVLLENNLRPSYISGSSVGSIIAALYASGMSPYQMDKIAREISPQDYLDYNFCGILKYLISLLIPRYQTTVDGIISGNKIEKMMYELTRGKRLEDIKIPLAIVSCDIDSGRKVIFSNKHLRAEEIKGTIIINEALLSEAIRSSIAIPVTFKPKIFDKMKMVDGGIKDIVPAMVQKEIGAEYVLAINLGQKTYKRKVEGIPQIVSRTLDIMTFETSETEENIYADMIIYPGVKKMDLDDLDDAGKIITAGRHAMKEKIEELSTALI